MSIDRTSDEALAIAVAGPSRITKETNSASAIGKILLKGSIS